MVTKKINLKPTPGYVVVRPEDPEVKTSSGIYLPDTGGEKPQKGLVISVGADEILDNGKLRKPTFKNGDSVIYKKWGGNEVKIDGIEYLFVKFDDILAVLN